MSKAVRISRTSPRGLLHEGESSRHFNLEFYSPPERLKTIVSSVWHVKWYLPERETYLQSNVPHPVQHIVLDPQRGSGFYGCVTKIFDYEIQGSGQVLGFKLFPGMGRAFVDVNLPDTTDGFLPLQELIGAEVVTSLEAELFGPTSTADLLEVFGEHLTKRCGVVSQAMQDVQSATEWIESSEQTYRVDNVADYLGCSVRQLQRLFLTYLGVPPKWVIDRYRILDAVTEMNAYKHVDIVNLALRLGYSDQAHFSKKFKEITGFSPASYHRRQVLNA